MGPKAKWRRVARRGVWALADTMDRATGKDCLVPPRYLANWAGGVRDFGAVGQNWLRRFKEYGGLVPDDDVLDVGCGAGRVAVALLNYIQGRYEGFDILAPAITWCQRNITAHNPQFNFTHADVWNPFYNPTGSVPANKFRFPYGDNSFDFAFATSVFTHMLRDEVSNYLAELRRVLRPDSTCLLTFYLLDDTTRAAMRQGATRHRFDQYFNGSIVNDLSAPTVAVAYEQSDVFDLIQRSGLKTVKVARGAWRGSGNDHGQDLVLAWKP